MITWYSTSIMIKDKLLQVKITEGDKTMLKQAATREGLELSAWVRSVLVKAARLILGMT